MTRHFTQRESNRTLEHSVGKFASAEDARLLTYSKDVLRPNPHSVVSVVQSRTVTDLEIPGVDAYQVFDQDTIGPRGPGVVRCVAASRERLHFVIYCASPGDLWKWSEVLRLCELQVARIRAMENGSDVQVSNR